MRARLNSISKRFGLILILATGLVLSGCGGGSGSPSGGSVVGGLDAAKKLFTAMRSNVLSISNDQQSGVLQTEAKAMSDDFTNLHQSGAFELKDLLNALTRAAEFLSDAAASGGKPSGTFVPDATKGDYYQRDWGTSSDPDAVMTCRYYTTTGPGLPSATPPRTPAGAGKAVCWYFSDPVTQVLVKVSAGATGTGDAYDYSNWTRTYGSAGCTDYFNAGCAASQTAVVGGAFNASRNDSGWTSVSLINGKLIPWIQGATDSTANISWSMSSANGTDTVALSGSIASTNATDSTKSVSLSFLPNSKMSLVNATGAESATLIGQVKTGAFEYDGTFTLSGTSAGGFTTDSLTSASFTGKISTVSGSAVTELLDGTVAADNSTNKRSFSLKVTNGGAVTDISGKIDHSISGQTGMDFTYNFGGSYSLTASGTEYDNQNTPTTLTITASDGTKIVLTRDAQGTSGKVMDSAGSQIGSIAPKSSQVNFVDGTFLQLL